MGRGAGGVGRGVEQGVVGGVEWVQGGREVGM